MKTKLFRRILSVLLQTQTNVLKKMIFIFQLYENVKDIFPKIMSEKTSLFQFLRDHYAANNSRHQNWHQFRKTRTFFFSRKSSPNRQKTFPLLSHTRKKKRLKNTCTKNRRIPYLPPKKEERKRSLSIFFVLGKEEVGNEQGKSVLLLHTTISLSVSLAPKTWLEEHLKQKLEQLQSFILSTRNFLPRNFERQGLSPTK